MSNQMYEYIFYVTANDDAQMVEYYDSFESIPKTLHKFAVTYMGHSPDYLHVNPLSRVLLIQHVEGLKTSTPGVTQELSKILNLAGLDVRVHKLKS